MRIARLALKVSIMTMSETLRLTVFLLLIGAVVATPGIGRAQVPIEEAQFVRIGGVEQWVTIRGRDRARPVLLVLHGGPGDVQSPLAASYAPLEEPFVVVHWDQRGAGRTLARAGHVQTTSLALLITDGIALTEYLRDYLETDRIVLLGHSWGSFLGVHIVKQRPELFRAFVGTGQVVRWADMVESQYRLALERARAEGNFPAVRELETLGVPKADDFDQYLVMRRWLNRYLAPADVKWIGSVDSQMAGVLDGENLRAYRQGFRTMTGIPTTVFSMDVRPLGLEFKLPVFVIQGSDDYITPLDAARSYLDGINAPAKGLIVIQRAGHFAPMTHMSEFAAALSQHVLPAVGSIQR